MPEPLDEERRRRLIEKLERLKQPGGGESPVATLEQPAPTQGAGQPTAQPTAKLPPALSRQEHLLREVSLLNRVLYDETTGRIRPELAEVARAGHGQFAPEVLDAFMTRVPAYRDLSSQERQQFLQSRWAQRRMVGAPRHLTTQDIPAEGKLGELFGHGFGVDLLIGGPTAGGVFRGLGRGAAAASAAAAGGSGLRQLGFQGLAGAARVGQVGAAIPAGAEFLLGLPFKAGARLAGGALRPSPPVSTTRQAPVPIRTQGQVRAARQELLREPPRILTPAEEALQRIPPGGQRPLQEFVPGPVEPPRIVPQDIGRVAPFHVVRERTSAEEVVEQAFRGILQRSRVAQPGRVGGVARRTAEPMPIEPVTRAQRLLDAINAMPAKQLDEAIDAAMNDIIEIVPTHLGKRGKPIKSTRYWPQYKDKGIYKGLPEVGYPAQRRITGSTYSRSEGSVTPEGARDHVRDVLFKRTLEQPAQFTRVGIADNIYTDAYAVREALIRTGKFQLAGQTPRQPLVHTPSQLRPGVTTVAPAPTPLGRLFQPERARPQPLTPAEQTVERAFARPLRTATRRGEDAVEEVRRIALGERTPQRQIAHLEAREAGLKLTAPGLGNAGRKKLGYVRDVLGKLRGGGTGGGAQPPTGVAGAVPDPAQPDVVNKLTALIKKAKPLDVKRRGTERARLRQRVAAAGERLTRGADATRALGRARGAMAGPLREPSFLPPQEGLTGLEVNQLKDMVRYSDETLLNILQADDGLKNILLGSVPQRSQLVILERIFGTQFAKAVLGQRSLGAKSWELAMNIWNFPRALVTSHDLSGPLRQGALLIGHPQRFLQNHVPMFKALMREANAQATDRGIRAHPNWGAAQQAGLFIADMSRGVGAGLAQQEEVFMSRWARKLPLIRPWARAYTTFLNKLRFDVWNDAYQGWVRQGLDKDTLARNAHSWAKWVNRATGRGPLGPLEEIAPVLNGIFFASRLFTSRFTAPMIWQYPGVRRMVMKDLAVFVGTGIGVLSLAKLSGKADVELDPRSADFGKIRIGAVRIDFWAGYQPVARYAAQIIAGQTKGVGTKQVRDADRFDVFMRLIRSKLGPPVGMVVDVATGTSFIGEAITPQMSAIQRETWNHLTPLFIQDLIDAIREEGLLGGLVASPGMFGATVGSYKTVDAFSRDSRGVAYGAPAGLSVDSGLARFEKDEVWEEYNADRPEHKLSPYTEEIVQLDAEEIKAWQGILDARPRLPKSDMVEQYFSAKKEFGIRRDQTRLVHFGRDAEFPAARNANEKALEDYYAVQEAIFGTPGRNRSQQWRRALRDLEFKYGTDSEEWWYIQAETNTRRPPQELFRRLPGWERRRFEDSEDARRRWRQERQYVRVRQ